MIPQGAGYGLGHRDAARERREHLSSQEQAPSSGDEESSESDEEDEAEDGEEILDERRVPVTLNFPGEHDRLQATFLTGLRCSHRWRCVPAQRPRPTGARRSSGDRLEAVNLPRLTDPGVMWP